MIYVIQLYQEEIQFICCRFFGLLDFEDIICSEFPFFLGGYYLKALSVHYSLEEITYFIKLYL